MRAPRAAAVRAVVDEEAEAPLLPAATLGEIGHLAARRYGMRALDSLLADIDAHALVLDYGERDIPRVRQLVVRYADLRLGFVDAFVAVCAERNGGRMLTLDRRHFDVLGRELGLEVLPGFIRRTTSSRTWPARCRARAGGRRRSVGELRPRAASGPQDGAAAVRTSVGSSTAIDPFSSTCSKPAARARRSSSSSPL